MLKCKCFGKWQLCWQHFWHPTPRCARKLGMALMASGLAIQGFSIVTKYDWLGFIVCCMCAIGAFLSNFFTNDEDEK